MEGNKWLCFMKSLRNSGALHVVVAPSPECCSLYLGEVSSPLLSTGKGRQK